MLEGASARKGQIVPVPVCVCVCVWVCCFIREKKEEKEIEQKEQSKASVLEKCFCVAYLLTYLPCVACLLALYLYLYTCTVQTY